VFGATLSWSDRKLEAGGIPNTPLLYSLVMYFLLTIMYFWYCHDKNALVPSMIFMSLLE
jgi:hypothetical protein